MGHLGFRVGVSASYSYFRFDGIIWYQSGRTDNNVNHAEQRRGM